MDKIEVGKRIKELREERGWAKGTLATRAGISPNYVPMLENGQKSPTIETLSAICFAFDITLVEFFNKNNTLLDKVSTLTNKQRQLLNEFLKSL